jgi:hypothetical protein
VKDEHNEDNPDTQLLVKTESPNVWEPEDRNDKLHKSYPILHGVKKLTFKYFRKDKPKDALNSWDSDSADTKNQYPDVIRIEIEVLGPSHLSWDGRYQFRPEIPLSGIPASG